MVFEYAIDPDLVATWGNLSNYRIFHDKFGLGEPRIMAEYPALKDWRRRVLHAATGKDGMEMNRVTAMISILSETMIKRNVEGYNDNLDWLESTEKEDHQLPFDAILALSNPRNHQNVLNPEMLGLIQDPKWDKKQQLPEVPRRADDMARIIQPLLKNCRRSVFIDPYFMMRDWRKWQRPFAVFMKILQTERREKSQLQIEVHSSADLYNAPSAEYFEEQCTNKLKDSIPHGWRVCFKRWKQKPSGKKLHDRYLITDIGGVSFSKGLDEESEGDTQQISLLKVNTYKTVYEDYLSNHPAFELEPEFTIIGDRKIT